MGGGRCASERSRVPRDAYFASSRRTYSWLFPFFFLKKRKKGSAAAWTPSKLWCVAFLWFLCFSITHTPDCGLWIDVDEHAGLFSLLPPPPSSPGGFLGGGGATCLCVCVSAWAQARVCSSSSMCSVIHSPTLPDSHFVVLSDRSRTRGGATRERGNAVL